MNWQSVESNLSGLEERPYQKEIAAGMLANQDENYLVSLGQGLGKTEITLMEAAARYDQTEGEYSGLVLAPNNRVLNQWLERAREYGMGDMNIVKNPTKEEVENGTINEDWEVPSQMEDRKERLEQNRQNWYPTQKLSRINDADICVSTYQLLSKDLSDEKDEKYDQWPIDIDLLSDFDEIIIDEATHFLAFDEVTEDGELNYSISDFFEDIYNPLKEDTRFIGLSALPDTRKASIEQKLDAEIIRPPQGMVNRYRPEVERNNDYSITDRDIYSMALGVSKSFQNTKGELFGLLEDRDSEPESIFRSDLWTLIENGDEEVSKKAQAALSYDILRERIVEANSDSIRELSEEIEQKTAGYTSWSEKIDEDFDTGKARKLRSLTEENIQNGERNLVFARYVDSVHNLTSSLSGETGVISGETDDDRDNEVIDQFNRGELDNLALTYSSAQEGLDLSGANNVIHMSAYPSASTIESATGRARRGEGPVNEHILQYDFEQDPDTFQREDVNPHIPKHNEEDMDAVEAIIGEDEEDDGEIGWSDLQ